jgi:hypothetical protein
VIIPAHNEERVLQATLDSVDAFRRGEWLPDVLVVADNCTDATAAIADANGARVIERYDPDRRGKGEALAFALSRTDVTEGVDFFFVLDADTLPEPGVLESALRRADEASADIVQMPLISRGRNRDSRSALNVWTTVLMNRVRPRGLTALGLPPRLQGAGILIRGSLVRSVGWPTGGLSEDLSATFRYLDAGAIITYSDEAVVWARAAETADAAWSQRMRWEVGRMRAMREIPELARSAVTRASPGHAAQLAHLLVPPLSVHAAFVAGGLISASVSGSGRAAHGISAALLCVYLAEGLRTMQDPPLARTALRAAPRFALWKLKLQIEALRRLNDLEWERTPRDEMD